MSVKPNLFEKFIAVMSPERALRRLEARRIYEGAINYEANRLARSSGSQSYKVIANQRNS